jgi:hypothetical protein
LRILITGSRQWTNKDRLEAELFKAVTRAHFETFMGQRIPLTFIHGDCPLGADKMASDYITRIQAANDPGRIYHEKHPADWDRHGKAAGFIRNAEMVNLGADLCIAFIVPGRSRGTEHTVNLARAAGIEVCEVIDNG